MCKHDELKEEMGAEHHKLHPEYSHNVTFKQPAGMTCASVSMGATSKQSAMEEFIADLSAQVRRVKDARSRLLNAENRFTGELDEVTVDFDIKDRPKPMGQLIQLRELCDHLRLEAHAFESLAERMEQKF